VAGGERAGLTSPGWFVGAVWRLCSTAVAQPAPRPAARLLGVVPWWAAWASASDTIAHNPQWLRASRVGGRHDCARCL